MRHVWWVVTVVVVIVLGATYLTAVASRVDRLHRRAMAARTELVSQGRQRALAASALAGRHELVGVGAAADAIIGAAEPNEANENDLTRRLRDETAGLDAVEIKEVAEASDLLALARQVDTDLVRDARAVRRHLSVRLLGFARKHPEPSFFDIDDPTL
jgi:Sec-independent protein translocase protein TatA